MSHNGSTPLVVLFTHMSTQIALIFVAIVVSWVMFVFNFVLGYYIGRAVEAGDQAVAKKKNAQTKKHKSFLTIPYSKINYN